VYNTVEECIGHRFLPGSVMPVFDRYLRSYQGGVFLMPVFHDIHQQASGLCVKGLQTEVVRDKQIGFFYFLSSTGRVPFALASFKVSHKLGRVSV
jgi:hypothetical protein